MWTESMARSFLVLAETSSFTETAERMFLTQQAVSKQISRLETALGAKLVVRERNNIHLTPAGEIYRDAFSKALDIVDKAGKELLPLKDNSGLQLRIGYLEMLVLDPVWQECLKAFSREYPEVRIVSVSLSEGDIKYMLENGRLDAAITFLEFDQAVKSGIGYIPVGKPWQEQICVSKSYPNAKDAKSYKDLGNITILASENERVFDCRASLSTCLPDSEIRFMPNVASGLQAVLMDEGGMLIGEHVQFKNHPELIFFELPITADPPALVWHKNNDNQVLKTFLKVCRSVISGN